MLNLCRHEQQLGGLYGVLWQLNGDLCHIVVELLQTERRAQDRPELCTAHLAVNSKRSSRSFFSFFLAVSIIEYISLRIHANMNWFVHYELGALS